MSRPPADDHLHILFVDDEPQARKYFTRAMARHFQVVTAEGVDAGRAILERYGEQVAVLIVDQRMPNGVGMDLLEEARERWPSTIRILTTAYAELNVAIQSVNDGQIFRYILKPWDIGELRTHLQQAMDLFRLRRERDQLLSRKMDVLQREMVSERVRSLAVLAGGLAHHIRTSLGTASTFLEMLPLKAREIAPEAGTDEFWTDLYRAAHSDLQQVMAMARRVVDATVLPPPALTDRLDLAELLPPVVRRAAGAEASATLDLPADLPLFRGDRYLVERLFLALLGRAHALAAGGPVTVAIHTDQVRGTNGVRARIRWSGGASSPEELEHSFIPFAVLCDDGGDFSMEMLTAYFAAHHHGGDIQVAAAAPEQRGFDILLPVDPAAAARPCVDQQAIERVLGDLAPWRYVD